MEETLLSDIVRFVDDLERKEAALVFPVPEEVVKQVKRAKSLETLLYELFMQVSGFGAVQLQPILRREFGIPAELMDHVHQWAPYGKERFEDELREAIDRADIRAGNQGVFFTGTPSKEEALEALQLLKEIAHGAIACFFSRGRPNPDTYVDILDKLLRFHALPNTYPEGTPARYQHLISEDRLASLSDDRLVTDALKDFARTWYRQSPHDFLERREAYFSYENVRQFLYALTAEQIERLQLGYLEHIRTEFDRIKKRPDLHRAKALKAMLDSVLRWK